MQQSFPLLHQDTHFIKVMYVAQPKTTKQFYQNMHFFFPDIWWTSQLVKAWGGLFCTASCKDVGSYVFGNVCAKSSMHLHQPLSVK